MAPRVSQVDKHTVSMLFYHCLTAARGVQVSLGFGVEVSVSQLRGVKWSDYRKLTRGLASILFSHHELATRSVTGQRWSRYLSTGDDRPVKPALDPSKIHAIIGECFCES